MKLTKQFKLGLIALICGAFTVSSARAALTYSQGDLLMAFRQTGNTQTYMVDLGSATSFRDATSSSTLGITGIAADMSATFGSGWYTDGTVFGSIVGANSSSTPLAGDGTSGSLPYYNKSIYIGKAGTGSASDTAFSNLAQSTVSAMATDISGTFGAGVYANGTATGNNAAGTLISTATSGNYLLQVPAGGAANYFNGLTTSTEGNANSTFDLYRILANNNNAVNALGNGVSQFQGSFSLSSAGVVSFTPEVTAAPEPSRVILLGLGLSGLLLRRRRKA